jgi:hypothetical protein
MDFKAYLRMAFTLFLFAFVAFVIRQCATVETGISAQRKAIAELAAAQVIRVSVTALNHDGTPAADAIFIHDSSSITQLVHAYQLMPRYVPGNGRLGSNREVNVTFELAGGRKLESFVSHNDQADLVFISTKERPHYQELGDFFASKEITPILFSRL